MKIILAGAGIKRGDMSMAAYEAVKNSDKAFLRTALSDTGRWIKEVFPDIEPLDYIYEKSRNFDTLSKNLAKTVLDAAKTSDVVYVVDGSPFCDRSCADILKKRKDAVVFDGVSKGESFISFLPELAGAGYAALSAYDISGKIGFTPCVIYDADNAFIAGKVKILLSDEFGDEAEIYKIHAGKVEKIKVYEADRGDEFDYSTAFIVPKTELTRKKRFRFDDLIDILDILRSENGCPWDKAQTKESVRKDLIEETYELVDAIEKGDDDAICEEAGDVILQAAFQCVFGKERLAFTPTDVISGICSKLISRHTHVFGDDVAKDAASALSLWADNKQKEKGMKTGADYLYSVPSCFPALIRAEKVGNRARKYNMDFAGANDALSKLVEEINEAKRELESGDKRKLEEECGDILFAATSFIRLCGVENELALKASTEKFLKRFKKAEELAIKDGKNLKELSAEEVNGYYDAAKKD